MVLAVRSPRAAAGAVLFSLLASTALLPGHAAAGDCNTDVSSLTQKRQTVIDKLNVLAKSSKGKLDPVASCPVLQTLVKAEGELLKYLVANKNWCNVPDEAVNNLQAASSKSQTFATQACNFAVQAKKAKEQQATANASIAAEAQKLPTGPL